MLGLKSIHSIAAALFCACLVTAPAHAHAQNINFGNNSSEYANDGECDDRRFIGVGMAKDLDEDDNFRDANDCRDAYRDGRAKLWRLENARAATQCSAIRFGNNSSEWSRDGECDDFRFEGPGMSSVVKSEDIGRDAADCKKLCNAKQIFLRDY
ncbi:MAG: hypothetical protein WBC85_03405 [Planktotalea sp.]|uniref:hypothetical protein n=1 Tax=Planktotalea sp. TaxID=2029877 RepID=UPI003C707499